MLLEATVERQLFSSAGRGFRLAAVSLLLIFLGSSGLSAQVYNLEDDQQRMIALDGPVRFHAGDDLRWADPAFDDSQWTVQQAGQIVPYDHFYKPGWFRTRVKVPSENPQPLSVLYPWAGVYRYTVYANGIPVGGCNNHQRSSYETYCPESAVALPPGSSSASGSILIAIRVPSAFECPVLRIGSASLVAQQYEADIDERKVKGLDDDFYVLIASLGSIVSLALFLSERREREYLWFFLLLARGAMAYGFDMANHFHFMPYHWNPAGLIGTLKWPVYLIFFFYLLRGRRTRWFYAAFICTAVYPVSGIMWDLFSIYGSVYSFAFSRFMAIASATGDIIAIVYIFPLLLRRVRSGFFDARLLLFPVSLLAVTSLIPSVQSLNSSMGRTHGYRPFEWTVLTHPFLLDSSDLSDLLFLLSMLAILVYRFIRTRRDEERHTAELEAARSMQSLLIPVTTQSTPGFVVESVYLPANEVGGDFFQVLPGNEKSLLIVVGDVSGKGLKAAMTVSTIAGALRNGHTHQPADVLKDMNRLLHGHISGFATCCATLIEAGGKVTVANAGHLSPYRNGEEIELPSGLPLGIVAMPEYEELSLHLGAGDQLTFLTDGVIEATDRKRTLFGFERTQAISHLGASEIAEAARRFGQDDDITVLTVRFDGGIGE